MSINYSIPQINSPLVGQDGRITQDWYLFFLALFNSVGGGTPVAPGSVDLSQTAEDLSVLTSDVEALEATAGLTIPAQPKLVIGTTTYYFVLGQGWVLSP